MMEAVKEPRPIKLSPELVATYTEPNQPERSGRIALNKTSTAIMEKNAVEFVLLLWDQDNRKVGIRPISKKDPRAYRIKYSPNLGSASFSAKTFFDYIGLNYSQTRTRPAVWNDDDALLEVDIPDDLLLQQKQQKLISIPPGNQISKAG